MATTPQNAEKLETLSARIQSLWADNRQDEALALYATLMRHTTAHIAQMRREQALPVTRLR